MEMIPESVQWGGLIVAIVIIAWLLKPLMEKFLDQWVKTQEAQRGAVEEASKYLRESHKVYVTKLEELVTKVNDSTDNHSKVLQDHSKIEAQQTDTLVELCEAVRQGTEARRDHDDTTTQSFVALITGQTEIKNELQKLNNTNEAG